LLQELTTSLLIGTPDPLDVLGWPWEALWAATWPVWVQTLVGIPLVALLQELVTNTNGSRSRRQFHEIERSRRRLICRTLQRTKMQTQFLHPSQMPARSVILIPTQSEAGRLGEWKANANSCLQSGLLFTQQEALHSEKDEPGIAFLRERYPDLLEETYELLHWLQTGSSQSLSERVAGVVLAERAEASRMRGQSVSSSSGARDEL
jgi:hypothetical protein